MTTQEILAELKNYSDEGVKRIFLKHGCKEPLYGVKVQDLKKIQKKIKKNHTLSLELYNTGVLEAMYLAGLIADEDKISKSELDNWAAQATSQLISESTVPWIAAESKYGFELGLEWIESPEEHISAAGWCTLASYIALTPDEELDIASYEKLLDRVKNAIHAAPNRVRYNMNGFVIAVGCYSPTLTEKARAVAQEVGKVSVFMGDTACKVPAALEYIQKVEDRGSLGKKRKMARC